MKLFIVLKICFGWFTIWENPALPVHDFEIPGASLWHLLEWRFGALSGMPSVTLEKDQSATTGWCPTWRCDVSGDGPWSEVTYGCGFKWNVLSLFVICHCYSLCIVHKHSSKGFPVDTFSLSTPQPHNLHSRIAGCTAGYSLNFSTIFGCHYIYI